MTVAEVCFIVALDKLCKEWKVSIEDQDNYDGYNGEDKYSGTDYYFVGESININMKDINKLTVTAKKSGFIKGR